MYAYMYVYVSVESKQGLTMEIRRFSPTMSPAHVLFRQAKTLDTCPCLMEHIKLKVTPYDKQKVVELCLKAHADMAVMFCEQGCYDDEMDLAIMSWAL
jgi:hypothetical protein